MRRVHLRPEPLLKRRLLQKGDISRVNLPFALFQKRLRKTLHMMEASAASVASPAPSWHPFLSDRDWRIGCELQMPDTAKTHVEDLRQPASLDWLARSMATNRLGLGKTCACESRSSAWKLHRIHMPVGCGLRHGSRLPPPGGEVFLSSLASWDL
jgi:hypothetical protein